jgi:hypothetical protein
MTYVITNWIAAFALLAAPAAAGELPMKGRSFGGILRAAPTEKSAKIASLRDKDPVLIVKKTDAMMDEFAWFQIKFRGRTGYQWGGILCSDAPLAGIYQTCQ